MTDTLRIERKRRPWVHTEIYGGGAGTSGVDLTIDRAGIRISGWYDSFVGIEPITLTWAEFDAEREALK